MAFNAKSANALSFRDTIMSNLDMWYTMSSQRSRRTRELRGESIRKINVAPELGLLSFLAILYSSTAIWPRASSLDHISS